MPTVCRYVLAVLGIRVGSSALCFLAGYNQLFAMFPVNFESSWRCPWWSRAQCSPTIFFVTRFLKFMYWTIWTTEPSVLFWFHVPGAHSEPEKRRHSVCSWCIIFLNAIFSLKLLPDLSVGIGTSLAGFIGTLKLCSQPGSTTFYGCKKWLDRFVR